MKKLTYSLLTIGLLSITPTLKADNTPVKPPVETSAESTELLNRLDEINEMDKSDLKHSEKKVLRKEVRSIEKQLKQNNGGVYLSVGAIIIIILLLIILL
jgi:hypothetical protein